MTDEDVQKALTVAELRLAHSELPDALPVNVNMATADTLKRPQVLGRSYTGCGSRLRAA